MFRLKDIDYFAIYFWKLFSFFKNKLSTYQDVSLSVKKSSSFFPAFLKRNIFFWILEKCLFRDFLQVVADSILTNYQHLSLSEKQQASKKKKFGTPQNGTRKKWFHNYSNIKRTILPSEINHTTKLAVEYSKLNSQECYFYPTRSDMNILTDR